jgi:rRNA maturation protein Nop10
LRGYQRCGTVTIFSVPVPTFSYTLFVVVPVPTNEVTISVPAPFLVPETKK